MSCIRCGGESCGSSAGGPSMCDDSGSTRPSARQSVLNDLERGGWHQGDRYYQIVSSGTTTAQLERNGYGPQDREWQLARKANG